MESSFFVFLFALIAIFVAGKHSQSDYIIVQAQENLFKYQVIFTV